MNTGMTDLIGNMAQGAISSITYSSKGGFGWDANAYSQSVVGQQALSGYLGGMAQQFISGSINSAIGVGESGFWKGGVNLAASAASTGIEYGASYAIAASRNPGMNGSQLANAALDGMGGITVNLADLGAIYQMASGGAGSGGGDLAAEQARQAMIQRLSGTGLLEMHFDSSGMSMSLGTGGISAMGDLYQLGVGLQTRSWAEQEAQQLSTENPAVSESKMFDALGYNYSMGQASGLATIARMMSGTDTLHAGFDASLNQKIKGFDAATTTAVTTANANGNRDIYLGNLSSAAMMATELAHESVRTGFIGTKQQQDVNTAEAVLAHTQMAQYLMDNLGSGTFAGNSQLQKEVAIYQQGGAAALEKYATSAYDSSADYWKLLKNGTLVDDGKSSLSIETANGGSFEIWDMKGMSKAQALANILSNNPNGQTVQSAKALMDAMGPGSAIKPVGVSEETQKRIGMYLILNAAANLTPGQFDQIAQSTFKEPGKLGYYIDFSQVANDLKFEDSGHTVGLADYGIRPPSESAVMNAGSAAANSLAYGELNSVMGMGVQTQRVWSNTQTLDVPNAISEDGNMKSGYEELQYLYNAQKPRSTGIFVANTGRNGRIRYVEQPPVAQFDMGTNRANLAAGVAAALPQLLNFYSGAVNGTKASDISIPMWSVGG